MKNAELIARIREQAQHHTSQNGQTQEPLDPASEFPLEILTSDVRTYVKEASGSIPIAPEMVAMPMLAMMGALIGNRAHLILKRSWHSYCSMYIVAIASPGTGKSAALDMAQWPLIQLQKDERRRYKQALQTYASAVAANKNLPPDQRIPTITEPILRDYVTTDVTMEKLAPMLKASPGITYVGDEITSWVERMNQYRKGGDRQQYMSIWGSKLIKVDRQSAGGSIVVERPVLTVVGGIQPDVVPDLHNDSHRDDGFVQRLLPMVPDVQPKSWNRKRDISTAAFSAIASLYRTIDELPIIEDDDGIGITLTPGANAAWGRWYDENAQLTISLGGITAGFYTKLEAYVPRFAQILHVMHNPSDPRIMIDPDTMDRAIVLGEWCREHINRFVPMLRENAPTSNASAGHWPRIKRLLERRCLESLDLSSPAQEKNEGWISKSEILHGVRLSEEEVTKQLDTYIDLMEVERREVKTATRPKIEFRLSECARPERSKDLTIPLEDDPAPW